MDLLILNFDTLIIFLNKSSIIVTWFAFLLFCFITILLFLKFFGKAGLYVYTCIAIIAANIQILKIVDFPFFENPIALGTILFSSTFLTTDILSEYYGANFARKNILIGFCSFLLMTIFMLFTIGFTPIDGQNIGDDYLWALPFQNHLLAIFKPFPIFFIASMIAYLISQYFDVCIYLKISKFTNKKFLWFRNNLSTLISGLLDNTVFSILAWMIFNPDPLDFNTVLFTFILGTYLLRVIIAFFDTPFIYLAKYFLPNKVNE